MRIKMVSRYHVIFLLSIISSGLLTAFVITSLYDRQPKFIPLNNTGPVDNALTEYDHFKIATAHCAYNCELRAYKKTSPKLDKKCVNGISFPGNKNGPLVVRYSNTNFWIQLNEERSNVIDKKHYGQIYCEHGEMIRRFLREFELQDDEAYNDDLLSFDQFVNDSENMLMIAMNSDACIICAAIVSMFIFVFYVLKRNKYVERAKQAAYYQSLLTAIPKQAGIMEV